MVSLLALCAGCSVIVDSSGLTGGAIESPRDGAVDEGIDGTTDAATDAIALEDAAFEAAIDPGISCGTNQCDPNTSFCCIDPTSHCAGPAVCYAASALAQCAGNCGYPVQCDDTADCADAGPNRICCAKIDTFGNPSAVACLSLLDCQKQGKHYVACDPTAATPCPGGATCAFEDSGLSLPTCSAL